MGSGNELELAAAELKPLDDTTREAIVRRIQKYGRDIGDIHAMRDAGVPGTRGTLRRILEADDELQAMIAVARGRDPEVIRDEIRRRAIEGAVEPVFGSLGAGMGSGEIGAKRVYSDRLLEMMAKAHLPEYRDTRHLEVTGANGGPVEVENPDVAAAVDRFTAQIKRLAERAAAESGGDVREAEPRPAALSAGSSGEGR